MIKYLTRRIMLFLSIILTVHMATFVLFFAAFTPKDLASIHLGEKAAKQEVIEQWIAQRQLDKPLFWSYENGLTDTLFTQHALSLLRLDFGMTLEGKPINQLISHRLAPSLMITLPQFVLTLLFSLAYSFTLLSHSHQQVHRLGYFLICTGLSVSPLFFLLFSQKILAIDWKMTPVSGFDHQYFLSFVILPNVAGFLAALSGQTRWFLGLMRQQLKAKNLQIREIEGMQTAVIMKKHLFSQSLVPIVTSVTVALPLLLTGSVLIETFFSIPGIGALSLEALGQKDIFLLRAITAITVTLYCIGLLLTDLLYIKVDPRIQLD